jgi:uncharacterized phiE125 gp8 family phage protein
MALELVTPPATYPVTVAELKQHLRVEPTWTEEDTFIEECLKAAIGYVDGFRGILGRCLESQQWRMSYDEFPCDGAFLLPIGPVISVESVIYDDENGDEQTWASANYVLDLVSNEQWIVPAIDVVWPATYMSINAVRVLFTAGYAQAGGVSTVPSPIKQAIKHIAEHHYQRKGDDLPKGVHALLDPWRWTRT